MIVVIGQNGQLAQEIFALDNDVVMLGRDKINITSYERMSETLNQLEKQLGVRITSIINAAGYTAVDKAENDQEQVLQINYVGVKNLAKYAMERLLYFVHISTDYVFDGSKNTPYLPSDELSPLGVYGKSKVLAEQFLMEMPYCDWAIIRTSWLYSAKGNNFVKKILELLAERDEVDVVDDQVGSPTFAGDLAKFCLLSVKTRLQGVYHWTDLGIASWYDFAIAIRRLALEKKLISNSAAIVKPTSSDNFSSVCPRPSYSVLKKLDMRKLIGECEQRHWEENLERMLEQVFHSMHADAAKVTQGNKN